MERFKPQHQPDPDECGKRYVAIEFDARLITGLRGAARVRDTNMPASLGELVGVIVQDRLVDAVLDD